MPFVPIKRVTINSICNLHWVRQRWMMRRTAVINQIRGLLARRWRLAEGNRFHLLFQN